MMVMRMSELKRLYRYEINNLAEQKLDIYEADFYGVKAFIVVEVSKDLFEDTEIYINVLGTGNTIGEAFLKALSEYNGYEDFQAIIAKAQKEMYDNGFSYLYNDLDKKRLDLELIYYLGTNKAINDYYGR